MVEQWVQPPVGLDADRWVTRRGCRTVLVMVHSLACGQRLIEVVALVQSDPRLQLVFTVVPSVFQRGVREWLDQLGALVVPWEQAEQTRFDLALTANYGRIECVHAPVVVLPHGAGYNKFIPRMRVGSGPANRETFGLERQRLVHDGRVVPAALVLAHEQERRRLAVSCPEALGVAVVAGDPCADRLRASMAFRDDYRQALGVKPGEQLVVAASTWGAASLLGSRSDVISRMVQEADDRGGWRVALLVHPNVWAGHGEWQVRAWMADWEACGLIVVSASADWRAVLVAADAVMGDHGSSTLYASLLGRPVLASDAGGEDVDPASPMGQLLRRAPRLASGGSVVEQIERQATVWDARRLASVAAQITSYPGEFGVRMRQALYDLLAMDAPAEAPVTQPVVLESVCGVGGVRRG